MAKMIPVLYEYDETEFLSLGIGKLKDAVSCIVTENRNDSYELVMEYPIGGQLYEEIIPDRLICCKAHKYDEEPEAFRIYYVSASTINGTKTVYARQMALLRSEYTVILPCNVTNKTASEAFNKIKNSYATPAPLEELPYTFESDCDIVNSWSIDVPTTLKECIFAEETGILAKYGGELSYHYDKIILHGNRGSDNGQTIKYGRNMVNMEVTLDESEVVTGICAYYAKRRDDGTVTCIYGTNPIRRLANPETAYGHIVPIDCTSYIAAPEGASNEWTPTAAMVQEWADLYLQVNYDGVIPMTTAATVIEDPEFEMDRVVNLCDIVRLYHPLMSVNMTARVVATAYNCLSDQWDSISIGSVKSNLAQTIVDMTNAKDKITQIYTGGGNSGSENGWTWKIAENGKSAQLSYEQAGTWTLNKAYGSYYTTQQPISVAFPTYFSSWTPSAYFVNYVATDGHLAYAYNASSSTSDVKVYLLSPTSGTITGKLTGTAVMTKGSG